MAGRTWVWVLVAALVSAGVVSAIWWAVVFGGLGRAPVEYVAVVELSGVIAYEESPISLFGTPLTPEKVRMTLDLVSSDPMAKAVVVLVNSPGGSAVASEEIYWMLKRLAEERVVVTYISEYGASGGYYISLAGDEIVASPSSLTGSVGAIAMVITIEELAERLGVKAEVFKSGRLKDVGNTWRSMTEEDRRVLQGIIDRVAEVFQERVREAREGKVRDWEEVFTAKPYTGTEAYEAGLVDAVGSLEDAVARARELAGLPDTAPTRFIKPPSPGLLELLFGGLGGGSRGNLKISYEVLLMWPPPSLGGDLIVLGAEVLGRD